MGPFATLSLPGIRYQRRGLDAGRVIEDDQREGEGLQARHRVLEVDVELVVVDLAHKEADVVVGAVLG